MTGPLAAVYGRISDDPNDTHAGVNRQLEDGRAKVVGMSGEVVDEYRDDSISALTGKRRPGYERLMRDADAGRFKVIVVFHLSRLWRNRVERAQGIERLRRAGISVLTIKGPHLDLSTAAGRGMAGLLGEFDTMESEVKSERVTRAAQQRAEEGRPNGSIPFGWTRTYGENGAALRDVADPVQAPVVREVCHRLLAGQSLKGVTAWVNSTGVPAPGSGHKLRGRERGRENPTGQLWGHTAVKKLALRSTNAGLRTYHAGRPDEQLLPAGAEALITRDEWERLVAMYGPKTSNKASRPGGRTHLLSYGVGECGRCGAVLKVGQLGRAGNRKRLYACNGPRSCTGRNEERVDSHVAALLVDRLASADFRDLLVDNAAADEAMSRGAALRARMETAAVDYAEGLLTRDQLVTITAKLKPQIEKADREAGEAAPSVPFELLDAVGGAEAEARWTALEVPQRRLLVEFFIEKVVLHPTRPGPGFDPRDVEVIWRKA